MIPCGTQFCSASSWISSKARTASAVLFVILVTVHQGTCTTLKDQKAVFQLNAPDEYGTLSPGTNIPSLGNFTLCIDIRLRQNNINGMTAFTYNTDTKRIHSRSLHELGIMVINKRLIIWLFHRQINVGEIISLANWHSLCLTWNGQTRETHVYMNKTNVLSKTLNKNYRLGQNGSLVLGRKHSRGPDRLKVDPETFVGDLYLFRLWDHAKEQQSISQLNCEDGNVITWDSQQWDFIGSILEYDYSLPCCLSQQQKVFAKNEEDGSEDGEREDKENNDENSNEGEAPPSTVAFLGSTAFTVTASSLSSTTGNSFINMTSSPVTANRTIITETPSAENTTANRATVNVTPPAENTTVNSAGVNVTLFPQITTGTTFLNVTASSQSNTTGTTFFNVTTSTPTNAPVSSAGVNVTPSPQITTGTTFFNVTASSPSNTTANIINGTSTPQSTTGKSLTTIATSPVTANSSIINVTSPTQHTTGNSLTTIATSPVTVNSTSVYVRHPPQHTTATSSIINVTSPTQHTTVNSTAVNVTHSPPQTTGNSSIVNGSSSTEHTTANSTIANGTSSPQNTTEYLTKTNATELNETAVVLIVSQLEDILQMESISEELAKMLINRISILINVSPAAVASSSSRIIKIVDKIGEKLNFTTVSVNITAPSLALAVAKINATGFGGADFSISNVTDLQVSLDERSPQASFAAIELPPSLLTNLASEERDNASRIQFSFYGKSTLFQDPSLGDTSSLNSYIIASSVTNLNINDLVDPVQITFKNIQASQNNSEVKCVFWDFTKNNGNGGWNSSGCITVQNQSNETVCKCNHLTHFGVLLIISRDLAIDPIQYRILSFITYIGCGISSICLAMTLVTYLIFEKLRKDYPSKILINLCTALLLLNMVFLIDSWISAYGIEGLCIAVAALLHYFLLVSFTWMSLEALHMYLALVKVFNTYVHRYILKFCILGWGVPIVVVAIILCTDTKNYGFGEYGKQTNSSMDTFCWINNDTVFYVSAVGYFCIMFLVNLSMFIVVLIQLCQLKSKKLHRNAQRSVLRDLRSVAGLTFLLGITWGFAFFAWGPVNLAFIYLFAIFNTLQGTFIFIFHCAAKENVQKQWRRYLCCGKLRLAENSDWSRTATNNTKKLQPLVQAISLSSTSNNSLQSTSSLYPVRDYACHPIVNGAKL
ncbi:adhesion G-protein coupled receptor G2-like isoform X2 [Carcharodon carcharias]|uniref:adhesion G-protein coupled receptor G2-like isoform X2 n=1 Tax=Carcharodon carcharias TaxID=13397 RepID=UPI001B7E2D47|nr:adhesion G-protein coupled receptor G2-like isoform X2 [Carcharodon carcharias]